CPGQTFSYNGIILNGNPPYNYTWSSGVNGQFVNYTINQLSGDTLILSVMDGCGYFGSDTIFFSHVPPAPLFANAGPDTTLTCAGQSVLLNGSYSGGSGDTTYFNWSNGAMTAQTLVQPLTTTTYILTVTNTCLQMDTDTMVVTVPPYIPLSLFVSDTLIEVSCPGNTADFVAYVTAGGTSPYTYQWSTGDLDSTASVVVNGPDSLLFTATDACGLDTSLYVYVDIMNGNLNIHTTSGRFCLNSDSTALVAYQVQGGISPLVYSWDIPVNALGVVQDTIAMNYLIQGAVNGDYIFTVTDACGNTASDTSNVIMISCSLDIPNVISPNGDGVNDVFYVDGLQYHPNSILRVYNRWGQLVYLDNNYLNNWDGGSLPQGTYFYIIELTDGTIPAQYTGTLTIFY
ncbi:MAG: gliding motility-associated C-terminal domain-containing protein, partial [Flavobacteriales bacterium]|nr:gliding motility-associated C-terminal domain-containing protein [Flavobacteriales bacterium]